jgi:hypothetical protein
MRIQREIGLLYKKLRSKHLLPRDSHLLKIPLNTLSEKDITYKEEWILLARAVLQAINKGLWRRRVQAHMMSLLLT